METLCGNSEGKVDPKHDTKARGRKGDTAPCIPNFDTSQGEWSA